MLVRTLAAGAALLVVVSCKAPLPPEAASPTRAPELAASAAAFTPSEPASTSPSDERTSTEPSPGDPPGTPADPPPRTSSDPPASPGEASAPGTAAPADPERRAAFRMIGSVDDPAGDHGLEGPDHADIRRVTVEDDGRRVRIRVEVAATLPTPPADGEVIGLGVDLLEQDRGESAYQVFADGGSDGWFAYLQTPDGFVEYPGQFRVGGAVVEFVIPWEEIGSPASGPFGTFLDWSRERPIANAAASDRAPDSGDASFDR